MDKSTKQPLTNTNDDKNRILAGKANDSSRTETWGNDSTSRQRALRSVGLPGQKPPLPNAKRKAIRTPPSGLAVAPPDGFKIPGPKRTEARPISRGDSIPPPALDKKTVGRYEVIYPIAVGGMAGVHVGRLQGMAGFEKLVAIKVIHPHLAINDSFVNMFLDEARLAAQIRHPNVAEIYEVGEDDGTYYMVGELIEGRDLRGMMKRANRRGTRVSHVLLADIVSRVCQGLHEAHELLDSDGKPLNLIHRDISPRNILISYKGHIKLIDFGVAWASQGRLTHTAVGSAKGKVGFMSPEQLRGQPLDRRCDIFALGVTLFMLVSGRSPFPGRSEGEKISKILVGRYPSVRDVNSTVDPELERIITKAMSPQASGRYSTAAEMSIDLARFISLSDEGVGAAKLGVMMRKLFSREIEEHAEKVRAHRRQSAETKAIEAAEASLDATDENSGQNGDSLENADESDSSSHSMNMLLSKLDNLEKKRSKQNRRLLIASSIAIAALMAVIMVPILKMNDSELGSRAISASSSDILVAEDEHLSLNHKSEPGADETILETISISLTGLPIGSVVIWNGRVVRSPFDVPRGKDSVMVEVSAPGYKKITLDTVPNEDKTLYITDELLKASDIRTLPETSKSLKKGTLENNRKLKRPQKKNSKGARKSSGKSGKSSSWESNPFG